MTQDNKASIRMKVKEFCSETNFLPASQVYKSNNWIKAVFVLVLSLGMSGFMIYQIYTLVDKYYEYPIQVEIELVSSKDQEFPSITICNLNPMRLQLIPNETKEILDEHRDDGTSDPIQFLEEVGNKLKEVKVDIVSDNKINIDLFGLKISLGDDDDETSNAPNGNNSYTTTPTSNASISVISPTKIPDSANITATDDINADNNITRFTDETTSTTTPNTTTTEESDIIDIFGDLFGRRRKRDTDVPTELSSDERPQQYMANNSYNQWTDGLSSTDKSKFYKTVSGLKKAFDDIVEQMKPAELASYAHQLKDLLLSCRYEGFSCSPQNFTTYENYKYGRCYTFNPALIDGISVPPLTTLNAGQLYGLDLELFIEQDSYTPSLSPQAGVRVHIHRRGQMPFPEDEGFTISPGYATSVGIKKTETIRLPKPYGICSNVSVPTLYSEKYNVSYTRAACQKSCLQSKIIHHCGCAYAKYVVPDYEQSNVCRQENVTCARNYEERFRRNEIGLDCDTDCPILCKVTRYDASMSSSAWPSTKYKDDWVKRSLRASSKMREIKGTDKLNSNVAKLEVYFNDLDYMKVEQKVAYPMDSLISDLGGQLGLYMGISFLVLAELLDLLINVTLIVGKKFVYKYRHTHSNPISPGSMRKKVPALDIEISPPSYESPKHTPRRNKLQNRS